MSEGKKAFKLQELHTPSAFEGALWTMLGVRDARTVLHSPPGCYINQHTNALVNDWTAELYSSNLTYGAILQGGEDRLEKVLGAVAAERPAAIFVVTSPPVEVAQDDVEGVAVKVGYPNTLVVRPPIGGTARDGREAAFLKLLDLMEPAPEKRRRSVNIIGPTFSMFNWMADLYELRRMLAAVGVEVNAVLSAGASVEELRRAPSAALNLCIYPFDCGLETAKEMERRFGIPYLADVIPIGFENSALWIEQIAARLEVDPSRFLAKEVASALEFIRSNMVFTVTFEMSAALSFENHNTYGVGIAEFYKKEVGVDIVLAAVSDPAALERIARVCSETLLSPTIDEKRERFVATSPMAIFGNFYDKKIAMDEGFSNFIFADLPSIGYLNTENCPFMGFMGAKYLVQTLVNEVYMGIFLETKGAMTGPIAVGEIPWELPAEQALGKISEMIPHFVRAFAVKKLHQGCEELAKARGTRITLDIVREVSEKYTPTKFKTKFSAVFDAGAEEGEEGEEEVPLDALAYVLPWDEEARQMLALVPSPFRQVAATNTEGYCREHGSDRVTLALFEAFRKELGM